IPPSRAPLRRAVIGLVSAWPVRFRGFGGMTRRPAGTAGLGGGSGAGDGNRTHVMSLGSSGNGHYTTPATPAFLPEGAGKKKGVVQPTPAVRVPRNVLYR